MATDDMNLRINMIVKAITAMQTKRKIFISSDDEKRKERIAQASVLLGYALALHEVMSEGDRRASASFAKDIKRQLCGEGTSLVQDRPSDLLLV